MNNRAQSNGTIDGVASEGILKSDVKPTSLAAKAYEFIKTEILRVGLAPGEVFTGKTDGPVKPGQNTGSKRPGSLDPGRIDFAPAPDGLSHHTHHPEGPTGP